MKKLLIIDNYDSFTWSIYQYFRQLDIRVLVYKNDSLTIKDINQISPEYIVISPGPGSPDKSGVSLKVIKYFSGKIPILGICLGHQAIGQVFGASIVHANKVMHGKTSVIYHNNKGIFFSIKQKIKVVRYHSLIIDNNIPPCLEITAWHKTKDQNIEIMAIRHRILPIEGVQFHPESVISEQGLLMFKNFLKL